MAGEISALTLLGVPSAPLEIEVLDPGDTTMSSSGTNKRAVLAGPYLIETITNAVAGEFDFNSIPAGFKRLMLIGHARSNGTGTVDAVYCLFNADTTVANYHSQVIRGFNAAASGPEGDTPNIFTTPAASSPANSHAQFSIAVEHYEESTLLKTAQCTFMSYDDTDIQRTGMIGVVSAITAAITRLRLQTDNHPTDGLVGEVSLYGMF
jgi:hypothetical protein